jgi:hypothetical protein
MHVDPSRLALNGEGTSVLWLVLFCFICLPAHGYTFVPLEHSRNFFSLLVLWRFRSQPLQRPVSASLGACTGCVIDNWSRALYSLGDGMQTEKKKTFYYKSQHVISASVCACAFCLLQVVGSASSVDTVFG